MIEAARAVSCVFCDVDGVLTDGSLPFVGEEQRGKCFHAQDGAMIKQAMQLGLEIGILSGRQSPAVAARAAELGIRHCLLGIADKAAALADWAGQTGRSLQEIAYIGDDLPDLAVCASVGWSVAVADACPSLRRRCDWVCSRAGGRGAVAEILGWLLQLQQRQPGTDMPAGHG